MSEDPYWRPEPQYGGKTQEDPYWRPKPKLSHERTEEPSDRSPDDLTEEDSRDKCLAILDDLGIAPLEDEHDGWLRFRCPLGHRNGDPKTRAGFHYRGDGLPGFNCFGHHGGMGIIAFIVESGFRSTKFEAMQFMLDGVVANPNRVRQERAPDVPVRHSLSRLEGWRGIHPYLLERGIPEANCIKHELGHYLDPQYGECITIPVFDSEDDGCFPGWQYRPVNYDGQGEKYKCSPGLKIGQILYNAQVRSPVTVAVESPLSVVAKSHLDAGYGFVATFGGPKKGQYDLLAQYDPLILWFDNDSPGVNFTVDAGYELKSRTTVYVVDNPDLLKKDADMFQNDEVLRLLAESIPYEEWLADKYFERAMLARQAAGK